MLSHLGHVAAMEEFAFAKNPAKKRGLVGSHLEVVPAPFSRFFIANTLHHRLLIGSLAIARQLCDEVDRGGASESVERAGRSSFPTPSPAWRERAGVRVSPVPTLQALRWFALRQAAHSLYRSTPSKQASGVHRINPIIDGFTASAALNSVFAARTPTTRSRREPARYALRSGLVIFSHGYQLIGTNNSSKSPFLSAREALGP